jgi:hypothetical protein
VCAKREIHIRDGSDDELRVINVRHLYHSVGITPSLLPMRIIGFGIGGIGAKHEVLRGYGGLMGGRSHSISRVLHHALRGRDSAAPR